ncbi:hypothetical protein KUTG_09956 [Kutzneria sp. 744]|nr:hypothetical protein KUTG_09956 [Kutzneria sp. 744]
MLRHDHDVSVYVTYKTAFADLAQRVYRRWNYITHHEGVPSSPSELSERDAVALYYKHRACVESYSLYGRTVEGTTRSAEQARQYLLSTDPSPAGAAVRTLFKRLKTIEQGDGNWPGGDVIMVLCQWLTDHGFDV